jgi:hypothetical protein
MVADHRDVLAGNEAAAARRRVALEGDDGERHGRNEKTERAHFVLRCAEGGRAGPVPTSIFGENVTRPTQPL